MFLKQALALVTPSAKRHCWDEMIDHCFLAYRATVSRTLNDTPFHLLYGRDAVLPQDLAFNVHHDNQRAVVQDEQHNYQWQLQHKLRSMYSKLIDLKLKEQDIYKRYYDESHASVQYEIGDKVLVLFDLASKRFLEPRWEGPFTIVDKLDDVTYRVESEDRITTAHVQRLVLWEQNRGT